MAKKIILALLILIALLFLGLLMINNNNVDIYIDGENVSVETHTMGNVDVDGLNNEICSYTVDIMNDTRSNATTLHEDIRNMCIDYGMENPTVNIDSILGPNQIPVIVYVDGTSMVPTLRDGQAVLLNKTHNIHVGDIVVANSSEYGGIIKRVDEVNGNKVHLVSDNKEISYEYINGVLYEIKGISTWVNVSDINGVVIDY